MKIISVVLNNFLNDSRVLKECTSLKKAGYEVEVAALHEKSLLQHDIVNGINVTRIRLVSKPWSSNFFVQILKYIEFTLRFITLVYRSKSDIIHCNDLEPLPACVLCKWLSGGRLKIVYDAHELETEVNGSNSNPIIYKLRVWTETFFIKFVKVMITVSNGIADEYMRRCRVKPFVVMNAPRYLAPVEPKPDKFREIFGIEPHIKIFLYQGGLMTGRGIEALLHTFQQNPDNDNVLIIMGYGLLETVVKKAAAESRNIFFHDAVSSDVLLEYTASADYGLSLIENVCLSYYYCLPNKLFEYAMAGLPVLLTDLYEFNKMNEKYHMGIIIKDLTVDSINAGINTIVHIDYESYCKHALTLAKELSWEEQEKNLLLAYKKIIGSVPAK